MQPIIEELRRVAEREVVAVVEVIWDNSVRVDCRSRKVGLILFRTTREGHGIRIDMARLEEVVGRIARPCSIGEFRSPTVNWRTGNGAVTARAVAVLKLRHHKGRKELRLTRIGHPELSGLPLLRRDHDRTVRRTRPIERCGRGSGQNRNRLDILGVQIGNGLRGTARIELRAASASDIVHRDTVNHIEGIRRLEDRLRTAHDHLRGATNTRQRGVDCHAGHLARKRVHEVGILDHRDVRRRYLLNVV